MKLYLDMDGVLADFDGHYEATFGYRPDKAADNVDWQRVRAVPGFFLDLPPMRDMRELWEGVAHLHPVILTGVPGSVEEAAENKRAWVRRHLGDAEVICCRSREKSLHCRPGDVLVDDWVKYRSLWERRGGIFIVHTSARDSLRQIRELRAEPAAGPAADGAGDGERAGGAGENRTHE